MATQWGWAALALIGGGVSAGSAINATRALANGAKAAQVSKILENFLLQNNIINAI
jgi:hypothetical protein